MGFFDSLTGKQKTKVPASGFYSQPQAYQDLYNSALGQANSVLPQLSADAFTPLAQTADETQAFDLARQGLGTEQNFNKNISMLMNPYDEYVINDLNRQAQGNNSLVNQAATQAGQQGSNRSFLGTSDVEQNRLNSIGQFRQSQYNNAVNQALGPLAGLQQQDISNLLGIGTFQRGLDYETNMAPLNSANAQLGLLNSVPTSFGNFGTKEQTIKTGGGLGGLLSGPVGQLGMSYLTGGLSGLGAGTGAAFGGSGLMGANQAAGSLMSSSQMGPYQGFFSDERLKENIEKVGEENGFNIYEFSYIGDSSRFRGVMAQEVKEIMPEAVFESEGFMRVNYDMIGVEMRIV